MNLDMTLPERFILDLGSATSRLAVTTAMDKAFHTMFGRALWTQVDVGLGRCTQDARDLDVVVWNRALVKARDADYQVENLK